MAAYVFTAQERAVAWPTPNFDRLAAEGMTFFFVLRTAELHAEWTLGSVLKLISAGRERKNM